MPIRIQVQIIDKPLKEYHRKVQLLKQETFPSHKTSAAL